MKPIILEEQGDQFLIRLDKNVVEKEILIELLNKISAEDLLKRADLDEDIEQLGEEIKADWWKNNKGRWIK